MSETDPDRADDADLLGDDERWPDGLGEPGEFRLHDACEKCGCSGASSAVRFVPVWADGSGVLTEEEIQEVLVRAHVNIEELARLEARGVLGPMSGEMADDVVMHIEGMRDGSFTAWIIAEGGNDGQRNTQYGRGSTYTGAFGWRHSFTLSRNVQEITTPEDREDGLRVFAGGPGVLNFTKRIAYTPRTPEAAELFRLDRAMRDRLSLTSSSQRKRRAPLNAEVQEGSAGDEDEGG